MTTLAHDATLAVPADVAKCPYCDAALSVRVTGCEQQQDESWKADEIEMTCANEPDIDEEEWEDFTEGHSEMPYVYWLPVQMTVLEWINENYRLER